MNQFKFDSKMCLHPHPKCKKCKKTTTKTNGKKTQKKTDTPIPNSNTPLEPYQTAKNNEVRFVLDDPALVPSLSVMTLKPGERGDKKNKTKK